MSWRFAAPHPTSENRSPQRAARRAAPLLVLAFAGLGGMACVAARPASADDLPAATARSPAEERASFALADPALLVELVASEPLVVSPVALCWDADGAMYVAEMRDYPVGPTAGKIRKLMDRDGDGRYETSTIFAENLNFPNGVLCVAGGLLVTAAPDLLFLRDRDGDGVADERRVIFTGFGEGNQQLRANGLVWGLDNWIYGANGRSDGLIRRPDEPAETGISIRTRDFRFRLDQASRVDQQSLSPRRRGQEEGAADKPAHHPQFSRFEAVIGQSQFGLARDDEGHRFLSWNTVPIRQALFDDADLARNPHLVRHAIHDLADPAESGEVFPIGRRPQTFNRESTNHYNALAGLTVYRGDRLGAGYYGGAFVGESLSSLVHYRVLTPAGPTFVSRRSEAGREFLAASDPWFHPVFCCTGPDGSLYIADFYRRWVEHPQFVAGAWRDKVAWQEGAAHGRIWRVRRRGDRQPRPPQLRKASAAELVGHLSDENGWWRDTAQRLLFERGDKSSVPLLAKRAGEANPRVAVCALWTLDGLQALDERSLHAALHHSAAPVRQQAVRLAAMRWQQAPALGTACLGLANDPDQGVRFQLARAVGGMPGQEKLAALNTLADATDEDGWLARALSAGAADVAFPFVRALVARKSAWLTSPSTAQREALEQLAERFAAAGKTTITDDLLDLVDDEKQNHLATGALAILAGAATAQRRQPQAADANGKSAALGPNGQARLDRVLDQVLKIALGSDNEATARSLAVRVLGEMGSADSVGRLAALSTEAGPTADAAVTALCRRGDAETIRGLIEGWTTYTPSRRRTLCTAALESSLASRAFVDALQRQVVSAAEIDPAIRAVYTKLPDAETAARAQAAFAAADPAPRDEVLARYRTSLDLPADRERGATLFKAHCQTCHTMFGLGRQAGPDLSGSGGKPKETLLGDLLDPSRQVPPDYLSYTLVTHDGRVLAGILLSDTSEAVTLRRGEGADETVLRGDIDQMQAAGKSLMPEGFEQRLSVQDVADLLAFLALPERRLLEER